MVNIHEYLPLCQQSPSESYQYYIIGFNTRDGHLAFLSIKRQLTSTAVVGNLKSSSTQKAHIIGRIFERGGMDSAYMSASDLSDVADNDEGGLFVGLYSDIPVDDQKFYFHDIVVDRCTVTFQYSYCNQTRFDSVVVLDEPVSTASTSMLFAMGMCVCSWYWMGFYTTDIVICAEVCRKCNVSDNMMLFWAELYHQTCLEYVYVNHLDYKHINFVLEAPQVYPGVKSNEASDKDNARDNYSVLIPMGGKSQPCL